MSIQEKEGLKASLFSRPDKKLVNIKFFRGDREVISPDDLRHQVCLIGQQHDAGLQPSAGPTRSERPTVDIRKLVAGM